MDTDAIFRFLSGFGKPILLRRMTGRGLYLEVQCAARVQKATPQLHYRIEQAGGFAQIDREAIISSVEIARKQWPAPPRRGDIVVMLDDGWTGTILASSTSELPGTGTVRYDMTLISGG